jgi:predicted RNase H-like HicB family nuclease
MNHYSMRIEWSDEDQAYIVSFPEWEADGLIGHTHGATYAEAVKAGEEMLAFLIEARQAHGESLPMPRHYAPAS